MSHQNRVDPFGRLVVSNARGTLMGNRGILHDDRQTVLKTHAHQNWVTCALSYKDRKRQIMAPGCYTELFFLDEATALAAGHRPCAECRRARYRTFTDAWQEVHGGPEEGRSLPQSIDRALHRARITRRGEKVTFDAALDSLPDGTMFAHDGNALLVWAGSVLRWGFDGYSPADRPAMDTVAVLTPGPLVALFRHGFHPEVHASAERPGPSALFG
ncbi:hypothetical protein [Salipiger sp.]|uniref:hypothetical protein n=1 Tax=Salipiger sp. TaxID=2078585 RepID=UPI003A980CD4